MLENAYNACLNSCDKWINGRTIASHLKIIHIFIIVNFYSAIIRISQDISTDEDPESQCINYPDQEFLSYKDCDNRYVYKEMKEKLNIVPFWATNQLDEVTKSFVEQIDIDLYDYFDGTITSPCYIPCLSTKVKQASSNLLLCN